MTVVPDYRLFYRFVRVDLPQAKNLFVYEGRPTQVFGSEVPPDDSVELAPPSTQEGVTAAYWTGIEWVVAADIRFLTLHQHRAIIYRQLDERFQRSVDSLSSKYTTAEITTWASQEADAKAFRAGTGEATYLLRKLAQANETDVPGIVQRILMKADAYRRMYTDLLAKYQLDYNAAELATQSKDLPALSLNDLKNVKL